MDIHRAILFLISLSMPFVVSGHEGNDETYTDNGWVSKHFHDWRDVTNWINSECQPDSISDIQGFTSDQYYEPKRKEGNVRSYNIFIFCKQGTGGINVTVTAEVWGNKMNFSKYLSNTNDNLVIGFHKGDPEVIFVVSKN